MIPGVVLATLASGCASGPEVVRVYDGRLKVEAFVPEEAYATFLRGVLAQESGELPLALSLFEHLSTIDGADPEVWSRIGDLRCRRHEGKAADEAFARAEAIDATYAGFLDARARCLLSRGHEDEARTLAQRAVAFDPRNVPLASELVRVEARGRASQATRARAFALTVSHGESAAAWNALATWGRSQGDEELFARGLEGLIRTAPSRQPEIERGVHELLGRGQLGLAHALASALSDAPPALEIRGARDATVARLAVDEALAGNDGDRARMRADRGRVPRGELAARAFVFGRREWAAAVARSAVDADPSNTSASMVLEALEDGPTFRFRFADLSAADATPSLLCALIYADRVARERTSEAARAWLSKVASAPRTVKDPLLERLLVDLAVRDIFPAENLSLEGRIELSARRREPPPPLPSRAAPATEVSLDLHDDPIDARHWFLAMAETQPRSEEARGLALVLARAHRDPLVAFACSLVEDARGDRAAALAIAKKALGASPADPLLLSRALELTKTTTPAITDPERSTWRTRLFAVAATPFERSQLRD